MIQVLHLLKGSSLILAKGTADVADASDSRPLELRPTRCDRRRSGIEIPTCANPVSGVSPSADLEYRGDTIFGMIDPRASIRSDLNDHIIREAPI